MSTYGVPRCMYMHSLSWLRLYVVTCYYLYWCWYDIYIYIGFLYLIVADYTGVCPVQAPLVTLYLNSAPPRLSAQDARHRLDGRSPPTIERWTKNTKEFKEWQKLCRKNVRTMWISRLSKWYKCRLMSTHADSQGRWDETSNRYAMLRYAAFLEAEHRTVLLSLLRAMRCLGGTK